MNYKIYENEANATVRAHPGFAVINMEKEVLAAFTSKENAQAYVESLNNITFGNFEIIDMPINPVVIESL